MLSTARRNRMFGIMVTTALTGALLSGCATAGGTASLFGQTAPAPAGERHASAIAQAEAAVAAAPRDAEYRAALGSAYLDAGRFASAATAFGDAMTLGDTSPRTALSLALALTGEGKLADAADLLNTYDGNIAVADLGLALTLAGQPERGIHLMSNALRGGDNTPKMRQNLAYAYAMAGRWREARLMAEQDVPAGEVSDRIGQWALLSQPEAWQQRIATLLSVPAGVADAGQPVQLALTDAPSAQQLAVADVAAPVPAEVELPALAVVEAPAPPVAEPAESVVAEAPYQVAQPALPSSFQVAFSPSPAADEVARDGVVFASSPVVQDTPVRVAEAAPARVVATAQPAAARTAPQAAGTHLIQLGSFTSEQAARRAWSLYERRYPELAGHRMVLSEAIVQGKHYWRVSAAGYGRSTADAACGRIKSASQGCFAYAEGRPLPGAIDTGTRLAQR